MVDDVIDGVADLAQVVRRHVSRHAHGNPGRPVDQQVGHPRRQYLWLLEGIVEVVGEIHGLLVDVRQHFVGNGREPGLGVAHGRRGVAVDAAEVALPVDQRRPHGEHLGHTHQRVVYRPVAVGVELAQHLADNTRALAVLAPRADSHVVHGVKDPPLHGLQAVPHVRQRPGHDNRHRVGQIRLAHLVLDGSQRKFSAWLLWGRRGHRDVLLVSLFSIKSWARSTNPRNRLLKLAGTSSLRSG